MSKFPTDWRTTSIQNIAEVIRGSSPRPQGDPRYYGGDIPRLMVADISRDGKYVTPKIDSLTEEGAGLSRPVSAGTLVIVCSGVTAGDPTILTVPACIHDGLIALVNMQDDVYTEFLYYSLLYNKEALFAVATHGGAYSNLTTSIVRDFKLVLPSLAEQRKIAAILSTWDEAIDLTEQLIAAKQRRKQALMQRLLTGQVRFPGFEEEWTRNKLQNITTIDYGKSPNEIRDDNGCFYIWGTGGIVGKTNTILCQSPAVIIGRKGTIDKPILAEEPFWTIDTTFYCLPKPGNNVQWLYYALSQIDLKQYNEASGVPSLSRNTLYNIEMQVPPIAEQGKIAEIFLTCDKELALHQQKLTALRRQKQGLMQQLLTGRVRVVG